MTCDGVSESNFKGFEAINSDGALIGPWNPWLNDPKFGGPIWELVKVLSTSPTLPRPVREVAILDKARPTFRPGARQ